MAPISDQVRTDKWQNSTRMFRNSMGHAGISIIRKREEVHHLNGPLVRWGDESLLEASMVCLHSADTFWPDATGRLGRWRLHLSEFEIDVVYRVGVHYQAADAPSSMQTDGVETTPIKVEMQNAVMVVTSSTDGEISQWYFPFWCSKSLQALQLVFCLEWLQESHCKANTTVVRKFILEEDRECSYSWLMFKTTVHRTFLSTACRPKRNCKCRIHYRHKRARHPDYLNWFRFLDIYANSTQDAASGKLTFSDGRPSWSVTNARLYA